MLASILIIRKPATGLRDAHAGTRRAAVSHPGIAITAEYGSDLTTWIPAQHGIASVSIVVTPNGFEAGIDKVDVSIPQSLATGAQLFVHLKVTAP